MATKQLSSEIAENITVLKKLKEINPSRRLSNKLQDMFDALHRAQGKEWEEQVVEYEKAKASLDQAKQAAQEAINNLAKTVDALEKSANAFKAVVKALALFL